MVKQADEQAAEALFDAARAVNLPLLRKLLDRGADPNARGHHDVSILHEAAELGRRHIVAELLARGADPNVRDRHGNTPLHYAASHGLTDIISLLLARGAELNATDNYGHTALHAAAWSARDAKAIDKLLACGMDPNARNKFGDRPLHYAANEGRVSIVRALLAGGADIDAKDRDGKTAEQIAKRHSRSPVVDLLRAARGLNRPDAPSGWAAAVSGRKKAPPRSPGHPR